MFTHMDLHSEIPNNVVINPNCSTDYVRVRDGDDSDAPEVGIYCLNRVPAPITSQVKAETH